MKGIKAFLFDLDGTILDSKAAIVNVFSKLCQKYGTRSFTRREIDSQFGISFRQIISTFNPGKKAEIEADYLNLMLEEEQKTAKLFPSVQKSLYDLKAYGCQLALVTNKEKPLVFQGLERFELVSLFDGIVTISDVNHPKPHQEPIIKALAMLEASREETMMIGDSVFDVGAAQKAGVKSAVLDWYNKYPLNELCPDYYFRNIGEFMLTNIKRRNAI